MMAALLAFISLDWVYSTYNAAYPWLGEFLRSEEFILPLSAIGITAAAVIVGWRAKALAIGHRLRNFKPIQREERNMKMARQIRLEDAILKAIDGMITDKTMTVGQARNAFTEFANKMGLEGLRLRTRTWKPLRGRRLEDLRKKTSEGLAALRQAPPLPLPVVGNVLTMRTRLKNAA